MQEQESRKKRIIKKVITITVIVLVLAAIFYGIIVAGQNLYDVYVK